MAPLDSFAPPGLPGLAAVQTPRRAHDRHPNLCDLSEEGKAEHRRSLELLGPSLNPEKLFALGDEEVRERWQVGYNPVQEFITLLSDSEASTPRAMDLPEERPDHAKSPPPPPPAPLPDIGTLNSKT